MHALESDTSRTEPPPTGTHASLEASCFAATLRTTTIEDASGTSDQVLVGMLAGGRVSQQVALSELYARHSRYLAAVAAHAARRLHSHDVADIVTDSLLAVGSWASRRTATSVEHRFCAETPEDATRAVRGWLSAIVVRRAREAARERRCSSMQELRSDVESRRELNRDVDEPPSPRVLALQTALRALSTLEREALLASLPWYDAGVQEFTIPRDEALRVASSVGATPEALRQRRCRAKKNLRHLIAGAIHPSLPAGSGATDKRVCDAAGEV